jgi:hypothetical protein
MTELASYLCDKAAFPSLQPCDYHDMYHLQQALFKRAQQKQQQLSDLKDKSSADGVREEVVVAAALIQKLLRRALGDLILIQKMESKLGPTSRKLFFPNDGFFPAGTKKTLCPSATFKVDVYDIHQFNNTIGTEFGSCNGRDGCTSSVWFSTVPSSSLVGCFLEIRCIIIWNTRQHS